MVRVTRGGTRSIYRQTARAQSRDHPLSTLVPSDRRQVIHAVKKVVRRQGSTLERVDDLKPERCLQAAVQALQRRPVLVGEQGWNAGIGKEDPGATLGGQRLEAVQ